MLVLFLWQQEAECCPSGWIWHQWTALFSPPTSMPPSPNTNQNPFLVWLDYFWWIKPKAKLGETKFVCLDNLGLKFFMSIGPWRIHWAPGGQTDGVTGRFKVCFTMSVTACDPGLSLPIQLVTWLQGLKPRAIPGLHQEYFFPSSWPSSLFQVCSLAHQSSRHWPFSIKWHPPCPHAPGTWYFCRAQYHACPGQNSEPRKAFLLVDLNAIQEELHISSDGRIKEW